MAVNVLVWKDFAKSDILDYIYNSYPSNIKKKSKQNCKIPVAKNDR